MAIGSLSDKAIFTIASKIDCPESREEYLIQVCGDDLTMRDRVKSLLSSFDEQSLFLEAPAINLERTFIAPASTEAPGTQIGAYKIREQLGEGGMGVVYVAEQTEPVRRKVALKIIKPGMDSKEVIARFEAERQALAMMSHANIAKVLDGGTTEQGRPYFVMELVKGIPITKFCDEQKISMRERLELFVTVCQAVQHAHLKGIIHRDLKPSNVLVELHDVAPVPKVIDFGIAKATNQQLTQRTIYTQFSQLVGTPLYMSPEQAQLSGLDVDTRSDVYSLGVMLYELLAGVTPFDESRLSSVGLDEMRRIIREDEPDRPSQRVSTLANEQVSTISQQRKIDPQKLSLTMRRELDWIVMKALEKDRTRRYESASDLAEDIRRYLDDETVQACPPSVGYKLKKYATRHRGFLTTLSLIAATLLIATGVSLSYAWKAIEAREDADTQKGAALQAEELASRRLQQSRVDFDRALKSMDTIVEEISSAEFAQLPGVDKVRNDILGKMLEFYAEIIADHGNDPYARMQSAIAHQRIARLRGSSNLPALQLQEINTAVDILETLIEENPDNFDYKSRLGSVLFDRLHASASPHEQQLGDAERMLAIGLKGVELGRPECIHGTPLHYIKVADKLPSDSPRAKEMVEASLRFAEQHNLTPHPGAFSMLARFAVNSSDLEEAVKQYGRCIEGYRVVGSDPNKRTRYIERWLTTVNLRKLAKVHQQLENSDKAERAYREAFEDATKLFLEYHANGGIRKGFVAATRDLAIFLENDDRRDEAMQIWRSAVRVEHSPAELRTSHASFLSHNAHDSVADLTSAIETYPEESEYYRYRGVAYREQGEYEKALADADRSIELAVDRNPDVYLNRAYTYASMENFEKAEADYTQWVKLSDHSAKAYFKRAEFYLNQMEDYEKALSDMDQSLELNPNHGYRYKRRALAHFHLEHFEEALADIAKAIELTPDDGSNLYWIPPHSVADCPDQAFRDGMLELANHVIENHDNAYNRIGRAGLLAAMGREKEAMQDYDQAIELEPDEYNWRTWRIRYFTEREQWENLRKEIKSTLAIRPYYHYHYKFALTSLVTGETSEYRDACQTMLTAPFSSLENDNSNETHFVAWTCALAPDALDDYEPAIQFAQHAVDKEPKNQQYVNGLGAILLRAGQPEKAKEQLTKALNVSESQNTSTAYIRYFMAMTEHALGNAGAAKTELDTANQISETELKDSPAWNRKLTLELLRKEAESLLRNPEKEGDSKLPAPPPLPR